MEKLLTISELAMFLDVHPWTIRHWLKAGKIRGYGIGRIVRFEMGEVLRSLDMSENQEADRSLKNRPRQKTPTK